MEVFAGLPLGVQILVIVVAVIVFRHFRIKNYHEFNLRRRKIEAISEHLKSGIEKEMKAILADAKDEAIFDDVFGFPLDQGRREMLLPIIQAKDRPFGWSRVKGVLPYASFDGGKIGVKIRWFHRLEYLFAPLMMVLLMFSGLVMFIAAMGGNLNGHEMNIGARLAYTLIGLVSCVLVVPIGLSASGIYAAMRLKDYLEKTASSEAKSSEGK